MLLRLFLFVLMLALVTVIVSGLLHLAQIWSQRKK